MAGTIAYAGPRRPLPGSRSPWVKTEMTWTGWDGSSWNLTNVEGGVVLLANGVEGLHMPRFRQWTRQSPAVPGQLFTGMVAEPRNIVLPLLIHHDDSSAGWIGRDQAFWRSMHPGREGTLTVAAGGAGEKRSIRCRYVPEEHSFARDPAAGGWSQYAVLLVADMPFWAGERVSRIWDGKVDTRDFFESTGPHLVNLNFGHTMGSATIHNEGDEDAWPVWTVIGPAESATLGVAGKVVDVPFAVAAGKAVVVDTDPRVQTAMEYDYTPPSGFTPAVLENPADVTAGLTGRVDFAAVPAGGLSKLNLTIAGDGQIKVDVTPLFWEGLVNAANPFNIAVYNAGYERQGWIGDPESVTAAVQWNGIGSAEITVGATNAKLPLLLERGARVLIQYNDEHLISGPIRTRSGKGPAADGSMVFSVADDFRLFQRIMGWPNPGAPANLQPDETYDLAGPAETVLKTVLAANAVTRLGEPVTIMPDLGRGADITVQFRFHPLFDKLFPAVETAGLGVTVRQSGAGLVVDCHEPALYPRTLTDFSGIISEWSWTSAEAEATDIIIGGAGEGTARLMAGYTDGPRAAALGERIELFRDATDAAETHVLAERAVEAFAETDVKSGLSVKFAETGTFRYGGPSGVHVGDRVSLEVGPGIVITDTLRSVALDWSRDNGLVIAPAIGEISDNPDQQIAQAIASLATGVRDLRRK